MLRNIYFEGELGDKFVPHLEMECETPMEVFKCLDANFPDFKDYLIEKHNENVGFHVEVEGNSLEHEEELLMDMTTGDIIVTPIPAGAKSGIGKVLAAIAIVVMLVVPGPHQALLAKGFTVAGTKITVGKVLLFTAVNLAVMGITQMMAPDPSTDADQEKSYLFNGAEQNLIEGDPVPVLYGRLRVPGQAINFELTGIASSTGYGVHAGGGGNTWLVDTTSEQRTRNTRRAGKK